MKKGRRYLFDTCIVTPFWLGFWLDAQWLRRGKNTPPMDITLLRELGENCLAQL